MLCRLLSSRNVLLAAILGAAMSWTTIATVEAQFPPSNGGGGGYSGGNNGSGNGGGSNGGGSGYSRSIFNNYFVECERGFLRVRQCQQDLISGRDRCFQVEKHPLEGPQFYCNQDTYYSYQLGDLMTSASCTGVRNSFIFDYHVISRSRQDSDSTLAMGLTMDLGAIFRFDPQVRGDGKPFIHGVIIRRDNGAVVQQVSLSPDDGIKKVVVSCAALAQSATGSLNDSVQSINDFLGPSGISLKQICSENQSFIAFEICSGR